MLPLLALRERLHDAFARYVCVCVNTCLLCLSYSTPGHSLSSSNMFLIYTVLPHVHVRFIQNSNYDRSNIDVDTVTVM